MKRVNGGDTLISVRVEASDYDDAGAIFDEFSRMFRDQPNVTCNNVNIEGTVDGTVVIEGDYTAK